MAKPKKTGKTNKKANKSRRLAILIISSLLSFLIVAIGAGAAFYFYFFIKPDMVIKSMQKKMIEAKKFHYKGEVTLKRAQDEQNTKTVFNIEGDVDESEENKPKHSLKLDAGSDFMLFDLDTELDFKIIGKIFYLKANKLPSVLAVYGGDFSNILNKWGVLETRELRKNKELRELMENNQLFKNIKVLKTEEIGGKDTYHYQVSVDKEALLEISNNKTLSEVLTPEELEEVKKSINSLPELVLETWIGKEDYYLKRYKGNLTLNTEFGKITIDFLLNLSRFNQPVKIESPAVAEPLEQLFSSFWENIKKLQAFQI